MGGDGRTERALCRPCDDADKIALLELSRAFVFPSHLRSEAFGVALAEAQRAPGGR